MSLAIQYEENYAELIQMTFSLECSHAENSCIMMRRLQNVNEFQMESDNHNRVIDADHT